jgi:cytochrome bd-type quinol oxidase subunit 2
MNGQHFSQFPLFPWLGFLFFGGIVGAKFLKVRAEGREAEWMKSVLWWGAGAVAVALLVGDRFPIPGASTDIRSQPVFFLLRLGVVLLLLVGFWWYEQIRRTERSFVLAVSRETLLVYAAHLLIIYGTFWNERSLSDLYGRSLSLAECAAATLGLAILMVIAAELWGRIKQKSRPLARNISLAGAIIGLLIFLVR